MPTTFEAEAPIVDPQDKKEVLSQDLDALTEMLTMDRANGPLSPEDNEIYKELTEENRQGYVALDKEGLLHSVQTTGDNPALTEERKRESVFEDPDSEEARAKEAVMRIYGNIDDNWQIPKK